MDPILLDLPMPIYTPRLCIKPREIGEGKILNKAINESRDFLKAWMPFALNEQSIEDSELHCRRSLANFIMRTDMTLSIYSRDQKTFIGSTGFHRINWEGPCVEIGYWVGEKHSGKGYVTEAVNAMTRYAFEVIKAVRVEIRCDSINLKSLAVMQRLGFAQEGILKSHCASPLGNARDTIVCARTSPDNLPSLEFSWG